MLNKKLLAAGIGAVAVAGLIGGGTFAQFEDSVSSEANNIQAGTLDVNLVTGYGGTDTPFAVSNVKPGDNSKAPATTKYVKVINDGNLPGILTVKVVKTSDDDHGCNAPEAVLDSSCDAIGGGELDDNLLVSVDGLGELQNQVLSTIDGQIIQDAYNPMLPGAVRTFSVDWAIPASATNLIQSDSAGFELQFSLVQVP